MRGEELEEAKADILERPSAGFEAFGFQILAEVASLLADSLIIIVASKRSAKNVTYLNVETIVELEGLAEELDELEKVGEVPHVPDAMQHGWLCRGLNIARVELL
jgi:hypothetical protein